MYPMRVCLSCDLAERSIESANRGRGGFEIETGRRGSAPRRPVVHIAAAPENLPDELSGRLSSGSPWRNTGQVRHGYGHPDYGEEVTCLHESNAVDHIVELRLAGWRG